MIGSLILAAALSAPGAACAQAAGFTGHICAPATAGRHAALVMLGGSEGGDQMQYALPQLAQRGYVAVSVAYFGAPGLPQSLESVPVETVGNALAVIAARPDVDPNRIAVMGLSKGGELALLAASLYPQVHAVVAAVGSPFAWQGIARGADVPQSSWTYGGKALPYVAYSAAMGDLFAKAFATHAPIELRSGYDASLKANASQVPAAMFHLERIHGPVLFISAGEDGIWDSQLQSEMGLQYLRAHGHAYADEVLNYPRAGHIFLFASPQRPMTTAPMGPFTLDLGGTLQANLEAQREAWPKIIAFLQQALK